MLHGWGMEKEGEALFLVHIGNRAALPPGFLKRYCRESFGRRLVRWIRTAFGRLTTHPLAFSELSYRYCRIPVAERCAEADCNFSRWRYEDAYRLLSEAGFYLYQSDSGFEGWTPGDEYRELMETGRVNTPVKVLHFDGARRYFIECSVDNEKNAQE